MLTEREIIRTKATTKDIWLTDSLGFRGDGQLVVRIRVSGSKRFYYRYTNDDRKQVRHLIGSFPALSLGDAREETRKLIVLHRTPGTQDVRSLHRKAVAEARTLKMRERDGTFGRVLELYVEHLRKQKASSAEDVARTFLNHVTAPWPELIGKPATEMTTAEIAAIVRRVATSGKRRTADIVRTYLRAAFEMALQAENDPNVESTTITFGLKHNPAASVSKIKQAIVARHRVLGNDELGGYLARLYELPEGPMRALLLLCLLLGGQRPEQLARLQVKDIGHDADTLRIVDRKGRGGRDNPRPHYVPLPPTAKAIVGALIGSRSLHADDWVFRSRGDGHVRIDSISNAARQLLRELLSDGVLKSPAQLRDIRRTCETMLSKLAVSKDIRAQLLSHGRGGVQDKHYDRNDYVEEKRAALLKWNVHLDGLLGAAAINADAGIGYRMLILGALHGQNATHVPDETERALSQVGSTEMHEMCTVQASPA